MNTKCNEIQFTCGEQLEFSLFALSDLDDSILGGRGGGALGFLGGRGGGVMVVMAYLLSV